LIAIDDIERAKDNLQRLLPAPMSAELASELALLALQLNDFQAAEAAANKVSADTAAYPLALISLGLAFERSNQSERLHAVRRQLTAFASTFAPEVPAHARGRAAVDRNLMQLDARIAIREKRFEDALALLDALLCSDALDPAQQIALRFEQAQVLDALKQHEASTHALALAHELSYARVVAAHPKMAKEDDPLYLLDEGIHCPLLAPIADGQRDPIFVVGFPRSGTTLLEQLLDAHPALVSFDEQPFLQKAILQIQSWGLHYPSQLADLSQDQRQTLRAAYFARCAGVATLSDGQRYIDKNPLNIARLPLIQALFPRANVIVVLRHPADCVLSCYQQHFRAPAFAVTMRTLTATAQMYDRVFRFYVALRPSLRLPVLEARYESFVADTPVFARDLFVFLQLPWQDSVLNFTERAKTRAISTPSYAAVTEQVNARAVAKWQRYQNTFEATGAGAVLAPWIANWGY
jgi:hypothetical protein